MQPDLNCNAVRRELKLSYPRTCVKCGHGICKTPGALAPRDGLDPEAKDDTAPDPRDKFRILVTTVFLDASRDCRAIHTMYIAFHKQRQAEIAIQRIKTERPSGSVYREAIPLF